MGCSVRSGNMGGRTKGGNGGHATGGLQSPFQGLAYEQSEPDRAVRRKRASRGQGLRAP